MKTDIKLLAEKVLNLTRRAFLLGSDNIAKITKHDYNDRLVVLPYLFGDVTKRRQIDAIVDVPLNQMAFNNIEEFTQIRKTLQLDALEDGNSMTDVEEYFYRAENAHNFSAGNCLELSLYALLKLIELGFDGKIELVKFNHYDHVFLVINRPEQSDESNWTTWGREALIIDPHFNEYFSADQLGKFWKDKIELFTVKNLADQITHEKMSYDIVNTLFFSHAVSTKLSHDEIIESIKEKLMAKPPDNLLETSIELNDQSFREKLKKSRSP